jgi:AcrR family transcriptional regulator
MTTVQADREYGPIVARLREVPRPRPILDPARERSLTERQRDVLDHLGVLFETGFADVTMATLAQRLNCSLRTLYALAPSRDELVLMVVDRHLRSIGRASFAAMSTETTPLETLRAYLHAVTVALMGTSEAFARDLDSVPAVNRLIVDHNEYLYAVTRRLLELAVEQGEVPPVDVPAFAQVMAGLGWGFTRPGVELRLDSSAKEAADAVVDVIIRGLRTPAAPA